jgi:hypothetical protein
MSTHMNDKVAQAIAQHLGKTTPAKDVAKAAVVRPVLAPEDGQLMYSNVFGYKPSFGDFPVDVLGTLPDNIARLVPQVDGDYVMQKEVAALLVAVNHHWLSMYVLNSTDHSYVSTCLVT